MAVTQLGTCPLLIQSRSQARGQRTVAYAIANTGTIQCQGIRSGLYFRFKTHVQAHIGYFDLQFKISELCKHPAFPKNIVPSNTMFYPEQPIPFSLSDVILKTPHWLKRQSLLELRQIEAQDEIVYTFTHPKLPGEFYVSLCQSQAAVSYSEPLKVLFAASFLWWDDQFLNSCYPA